MTSQQAFHEELFRGLNALEETSFPRKCGTCGRVYATAEQFLLETQNVSGGKTGLKESMDDDGSHIVEVFRNCVCGSTLMDVFGNRRDTSEAGLRYRKRFDELIAFLAANGLEPDTARTELLKVMRGGHSEMAQYQLPQPPADEGA
jgi:hypothetical protein